MATDPANANRDCATINGAQQCYNGLPTIRRKTQWAMANAGGMMNWELSQDATGANSLVSAIYETVHGRQPRPTTPPPGGRTGQITGIAGKCVDVAARQHGQRHRDPAVHLQRHQRADAGPSAPTAPSARWASAWTSRSGSTANGADVQLWDCNGTGAQVWQAQSNQTLRNPQSNKCLDARGNSSADGTRLQIWDCFAGANQRWILPDPATPPLTQRPLP